MKAQDYKNYLTEELSLLNKEDKETHEANLKELIANARTQRELKKIELTINCLLGKDFEEFAA